MFLKHGKNIPQVFGWNCTHHHHHHPAPDHPSKDEDSFLASPSLLPENLEHQLFYSPHRPILTRFPWPLDVSSYLLAEEATGVGLSLAFPNLIQPSPPFMLVKGSLTAPRQALIASGSIHEGIAYCKSYKQLSEPEEAASSKTINHSEMRNK